MKNTAHEEDATQENTFIGENGRDEKNPPSGDSVTANRKYRDTVFRMLFNDKEELLSLFNAVNGTSYSNPEDLEITTLENAVYMSRKNDISCILDMQLDLYEHQSTVNPNIALRDLFYIARLLEKHTDSSDLYSGRRIELPAPKFIVFYNGTKKQPERRIFRLSDSYAKRNGEPNLELVVIQININPGNNEDLVRGCKTLSEYICYTDRVRRYTAKCPLMKRWSGRLTSA